MTRPPWPWRLPRRAALAAGGRGLPASPPLACPAPLVLHCPAWIILWRRAQPERRPGASSRGCERVRHGKSFAGSGLAGPGHEARFGGQSGPSAPTSSTIPPEEKDQSCNARAVIEEAVRPVITNHNILTRSFFSFSFSFSFVSSPVSSSMPLARDPRTWPRMQLSPKPYTLPRNPYT
jgi:hypothetical protein